MIGIKQGDIKDIGRFTDEVKDLEKQMEEFLKERNAMDEQLIYIDDKEEDIRFFKEDVACITPILSRGKI